MLTKPGMGAPDNSLMFWQWINFALLVSGLVYLANKYGSPYLAKRSSDIRQRIADARQCEIEAAAHNQEVERRISHLASDLEALRETAARELQAEMRRMRTESAAIAARIEAEAAATIKAAGKSARLELRRYASEQALALAAQKITQEMSLRTDQRLIHGVLEGIAHLARSSSPGESDYFEAASVTITAWASPISIRSAPLDG